MAGAKAATLQEFQQVTTDARGNAAVSVRIPDWAAGPGTLVFAFETLDGRLRAVTDTFRVGADPAAASAAERRRGSSARSRAKAPSARRCAATTASSIRSPAGNLGDFFPGDRVRVDGQVAQVSTCQQGTTIDVTRIQPRRASAGPARCDALPAGSR